MNQLLKAVLKEAMDLVALGKAAVAHNWSGVFTAAIGAGTDVPPIVSAWPDLKPELQALLTNPAADADLLAYAATLVGGESPETAAVVAAAADFLLTTGEKGYALYLAVELARSASAKPTAPPEAPVA